MTAYRTCVPELPELEAFVRAQRDRLTAEPVESVPLAHFATVKTIDPPMASLAGHRFTDVRRRAKRLLFDSEAGSVLVLHLMSAGRPAAWLLTPEATEAELAHLGPEPLDPAFDTAALRRALEEHPHRLHAFLRDQRAIAGIGRAYANEILHAARLSPYAMSSSLTDEEVERLHASITDQLGTATERLVPQSSSGLATKASRAYRVHDRLGQQCPVCGNEIRQVSFDEHTIYYCPNCQTDGRVLADRRLSRLLRD